ncbi:TrlF family AAA-like ATPase [Curtobacterium sp. MCJR17_020]|uniref:TrlF family AAA-like ATPase n=1 Tax=Curtobacterium sp. MCJR17_020 TaxID=2175619 RepID=UPI0026B0BC80
MTSRFSKLAGGTEWVRCAFQVNPYAYLKANGKVQPDLQTEAEYNKAMVSALTDAGIEAIGITDHWSVDTGADLRTEAEAAGLLVFPGFEATSSEGVHLLILFDPATTASAINRRLGECGIPDDCHESVPCKFSAVDLLERARQWSAVVIAPHVTTGGGLLLKLTGQSAVTAWTNDLLHAVAPGGAKPSQGQAAILANKDAGYKRQNRLAVLSAADISSPSDVAKPGSSSWVKLSSRTAGGLDLAFRTPSTRVSREDPDRQDHPRILGIEWKGGFLGNTRIRFNNSLNVLIGGRGTGKSTVLESIRYCLGARPTASRSVTEHDSMTKQVLGAGTEITLEIEVRTPTRAIYTISRVYGEEPRVRDEQGKTLHSTPLDVLGDVAIYGQRELADLARDGEQLTRLLALFLPSGTLEESATPSDALKKSREAIVEQLDVIDKLSSQTARLPIIAERLARFEAAGVGERLESQNTVKREEDFFNSARDALTGAKVSVIPKLQLTAVAREPGSTRDDLLVEAEAVIAGFNDAIRVAELELSEAKASAETQLAAIRSRWSGETGSIVAELDKVLRELQPDGIDGNEYLTLKREEQALSGYPEQLQAARVTLEKLRDERTDLLAAVADARAARIRNLKAAAKKVRRALPATLQATLHDGADRTPLTDLIRSLGGRFDLIRAAIDTAETLSVAAFASVCRSGADRIREVYPNVTTKQAGELASAGEGVFMEMEELEFPLTTDLQLNVGSKDSPIWRSLDHLSTGQRATALLLLLLKRGAGPLLIDQPEDDLDNRFINADIVPQLREKTGRQIIFSSHNANIPVLGDADQLVVLQAEDNGSEVIGKIAPGGLGSIDHPELEGWVEELLEGGRDAFNSRRYMYGF